MLLALAEGTGAELVWATYWRSRANTWVGPRIGLPALRHVPIPHRVRPGRKAPSPAEWKARQVASWLGRAPFVWFEDDRYVADRIDRETSLAPHLMVRVDPAVGLTIGHVNEARAWLDGFRH